MEDKNKNKEFLKGKKFFEGIKFWQKQIAELVNLKSSLKRSKAELKKSPQKLKHQLEIRTATERIINKQLHHEIEHRKQSEQAVQDSLQYANGIINTVREPLLILNADLRIISASRSFYHIFKVKPEETEQQHIYDLGNRQWDIPELRELLEDILPKTVSFDNFEVEHVFPGIGRRIMLLNAREIHQKANRTKLILLAIEDITERKRVEELLALQAKELFRSNTELERFAYVTSHDLQEPLRMVSSYVRLLEKRYKEKLDPDAQEFIGFAVDGVSWMQSLINALLTYSHLGTQAREFELTDCNKIVARALFNLQVAIQENNAKVTYEPLKEVMGDSSQLEQLFQNLIGNAIKFQAQEPPRVHISMEEKGSDYVFKVLDNGIGIDPKSNERIFEIFQRLHSRKDYPGTGIGLAICKKIVERHGGRIWVESMPGKGASFYFTIPKREG